MPPFGNLYDVPVYVDARLSEHAEIAFNAGSHTDLVRMPYAEFEQLAKPEPLWLAHVMLGLRLQSVYPNCCLNCALNSSKLKRWFCVPGCSTLSAPIRLPIRPMVNQSQPFWMPKIRPARNASPQPVGSVMRLSCAGGTSMVLPSAWITAPLEIGRAHV